MKRYDLLHVKIKVTIRTSLQPLNIIWLQEPQIPWPQEEGYGVRYVECRSSPNHLSLDAEISKHYQKIVL